MKFIPANLSLKQRIALPPTLVLIFLLVVALFSHHKLVLLGGVVNDLIVKSDATITRETDLANLISETQMSVSRYFNQSGQKNFDNAIASLQKIKTSLASRNNQEVLATIDQLEQLTNAAHVRFASLDKEKTSFLSAQSSLHMMAASSDQASRILELMGKVGNDMTAPTHENQGPLTKEFEDLTGGLPKGDLKFAIEDYWDIWTGYTSVYLKLQQDTSQALTSALSTLYGFQKQSISQSKKEMEDIKLFTLNNISKATLLLTVISATALILGLALIFFLSRSINRIMTAITNGIRQSSEEVSTASLSVTSASQVLSDSSFAQAASLEEISASLEEMHSMTRQTSENASTANQLMITTQNSVANGTESMGQLNGSMSAITQANEQTFAIIKTIEQIAFQTNLLALNAAVEAARAGEAGAGFAVVAAEVRSLAGRSSEAAGDTNRLIDDAANKVQGGNLLVKQTAAAYEEIAANSAKIAAMIAEIATAAKEQAVGVGTVKSAIVTIDEVSQNNAASSEELAAAAETMQAQARKLSSYVHELTDLMVGGMKNQSGATEDPEDI